MITGGMQHKALRISDILDYAAREHADRKIVTRWMDGSIDRTDWAGVNRMARKMSSALVKAGCQKGDRVATIGMNHVHHLAAYYGAPGMGGVTHTINPRLSAEHLVYIVNHADDRILFFDSVFAPIIENVRDQLPNVKEFVCFDGDCGGAYRSFLDFIADGDEGFEWVDGEETDPCGLCYTSGTTGMPKGVVYEHRSNVLHAMATVSPNCFNTSREAVLLNIVPLFHVNSWGAPFGCPLTGCAMVFSASNEASVLWKMIREEGVTHSAGVPTVWLSMFADLDQNGGDYGKLKRVIIGGSAAPRAMLKRLRDAGIDVGHAWGMTETSPIGTVPSKPPHWDDMDEEAKLDLLQKQGSIPFGVELRVTDDDGNTVARDGETSGHLEVRGHWIIERYFGTDDSALNADGWFDTGDIAILHPDGVMQITDRDKDVIKSGGEWISSIELENAALACEGVAEAAAIGLPHPKWDERPLLVVVCKPGAHVEPDDIYDVLKDKVAKWWLPDEIVFVDELPHGATGKILKRTLRDQFEGHKLAS